MIELATHQVTRRELCLTERLDPHCCKGQKSSCCFLHLHQQQVDRLSSIASLIAPPRAGPRQRTALLLCYRPVCSSNYQITSPHLAFCCTPPCTHTEPGRVASSAEGKDKALHVCPDTQQWPLSAGLPT